MFVYAPAAFPIRDICMSPPPIRPPAASPFSFPSDLIRKQCMRTHWNMCTFISRAAQFAYSNRHGSSCASCLWAFLCDGWWREEPPPRHPPTPRISSPQSSHRLFTLLNGTWQRGNVHRHVLHVWSNHAQGHHCPLRLLHWHPFFVVFFPLTEFTPKEKLFREKFTLQMLCSLVRPWATATPGGKKCQSFDVQVKKNKKCRSTDLYLYSLCTYLACIFFFFCIDDLYYIFIPFHIKSFFLKACRSGNYPWAMSHGVI